MDLLKRLYNIARAEMPSRGARVDEDTPDASEDFYTSQRGQRGKSPEQNPVLAAYYANLELPYGADIETVRRSWKRLMKQYHPDMHSTDADKKEVADELCAEFTRAYQELTRALSARP